MKTRRFAGIAAAPGIAEGPAFVYRPRELVIPRRPAGDPAGEWSRCQEAMAAAVRDLAVMREKAAREAGEAEAAIFDAHQMIIQDPETEADLQGAIEAGASAEAAVETIFAGEVEKFEALDDPYFRERAADFADVARRLLRRLLGIEEVSLAALDRPAVLVARDLLPSETAQLDRTLVRGFCTARGGPLSHTAILARNLGLPAVVGLGEELLDLAEEEPLIVDGTAGLVLAGADEQERAAYRQRAAASAERRAAALINCREPAVTRDGRRVEIGANIGLPGEETAALEAGAEGIGLLRTEFLFAGRQTAPAEEEQVRAYRPIFAALGERPVIARTLDIGGDKPAAFLDIPREDNPFLGWRAIRIGLAQPDLLKAQLRALLRAGVGGNLKIMFPMIAVVAEMAAARELCRQAQAELFEEGLAAAADVEIGAMIEVPSAALLADHLAGHADFFSIGSNDLTQYTLAADRGNPAVAGLFDALDPAVLRLIDRVIRAGHAAGIWVGLCGELAGDPLAIPLLLGLGLDEFSMGAAAVSAAKALIRKLSLAEAEVLAREALDQPSAAAVRDQVYTWLAARELTGWVD